MKKTSRNGKWFAITACILFIGLTCFPASQGLISNNSLNTSSTGNTLYVGGIGPGNYTKIQDAINYATNGDTVFVYSGIYHENLVINKKINLIGEDSEDTIIQGNGLTHAINIKNSDITISDFIISNNNNLSGIYSNKNRNITVLNCEICSNHNGIYLESFQSEFNTIINCSIYSNNNCGIYLEGSNNTIKNCDIFSNNQYGIEIRTYSNIIKWGAFFDLNPMSQSSGNKISNCNIYSNNESGVHLVFSSFNIISNCSMYSNNNSGIKIFHGIENKISNNDIYSNKNGIELIITRLNTISNCNISSNEIGIRYNTSASILNINHNNLTNNDKNVEKKWNAKLLLNYFICQIIFVIPINILWKILEFADYFID